VTSIAWLLEKEVVRELPEEWNGVVPTKVFMSESENIVNQAKQEGLTKNSEKESAAANVFG